MILRRITLERYGCFGAEEFEFRRGFNLVYGGNETGKSLLLATLPAVVLGAEHGMRLRSWGESLSCRATLVFESGNQGVRLTRELENNLVRLEERSADGQWRESFSGRVPPNAATPDHHRYGEHLRRLFGSSEAPLLRALLDATAAAAVLDSDGRLADGLAAAEGAVADSPPPAATVVSAAHQAEIAALEAELATDREEYRKGETYLAWIRNRWEREGQAPAGKGKPAAGKHDRRKASALEQQHQELAAELQRQGLPAQLPVNLPDLLATAEELRQELAALQQELVPLQRSRQGIALPRSSWPLLVTLAALAAPGAAFALASPWLVPLAGACGALLLLLWTVFLVRLAKARRGRAGLDREIEVAEQKRSAALVRQNELAEVFAAAGLPSSAVDMAKLQQLYQRNRALVERYGEVCRQLASNQPECPADQRGRADDPHLRPEELPEAQRCLDELGASLRQREARLQALRDSLPGQPPAHQTPSLLTARSLLPAISQFVERLTAGRYREVRLQGEKILLEAAPGQWVAPAACSRGTAEALVLAIRLALCQASGALLPVPIDDLPASFDPRRRQAALRVLEKLAADHQVLLATCDEELAKRAARERWSMINLNQPRARQPLADREAADAGQLHLL